MNLQHIAEQALAALKNEGADASQATVSTSALTELNITHSEPSLLRSTQSHKLSLVGIWDGRKASTDLSDLSPESLTAAARALRGDAAAAPQDTAHAVSSGQHTAITRGPLEADLTALADAAHNILDFRTKATPTMNIEEGAVSHTGRHPDADQRRQPPAKSTLGWYGVSVFGTARGPGRGQVRTNSSTTPAVRPNLGAAPASSRCGIADMMRELTRSVVTQGVAECFGGKFVGDVVLTPMAVATLLGWLQGQVSDMALISGSSMYRDKVGEVVASPLLNLSSRFDAPGIAALSGDAFVAPPLQLLQAGRLQTLIPSLYGSRKTGLPHVPTASGGWELAAGTTPLADILRGVPRGAVVGRLSMGNPAANGDFSGIIKNSFAIDGGVVGTALSETMINGNVAQMLRDVVAVSPAHDTGGWCRGFGCRGCTFLRQTAVALVRIGE
jgi:PmbA protein